MPPYPMHDQPGGEGKNYTAMKYKSRLKMADVPLSSLGILVLLTNQQVVPQIAKCAPSEKANELAMIGTCPQHAVQSSTFPGTAGDVHLTEILGSFCQSVC